MSGHSLARSFACQVVRSSGRSLVGVERDVALVYESKSYSGHAIPDSFVFFVVNARLQSLGGILGILSDILQ